MSAVIAVGLLGSLLILLLIWALFRFLPAPVEPQSIRLLDLVVSGLRPIALEVEGIDATGVLDDRHAGCKIDASGRVLSTEQQPPTIRWHNPPRGTKSFVLFMIDRDAAVERPVALDSSPAHQRWTGEVLRKPYFHWVLIDIPIEVREIAGANEEANSIARSGRNDVNDERGYFGPCPPPDDPMLHRYEFHLFAVGIQRLMDPRYAIRGERVLHWLVPHRLLGHGVVRATFQLRRTAVN